MPQSDQTAVAAPAAPATSPEPITSQTPAQTDPAAPAAAVPQSDQTAQPSAAQASSATTENTPPASQNAAEAASADQGANAEGGKNLPQTATPLPLLALLGLGSLTGGLAARKKK